MKQKTLWVAPDRSLLTTLVLAAALAGTRYAGNILVVPGQDQDAEERILVQPGQNDDDSDDDAADDGGGGGVNIQPVLPEAPAVEAVPALPEGRQEELERPDARELDTDRPDERQDNIELPDGPGTKY